MGRMTRLVCLLAAGLVASWGIGGSSTSCAADAATPHPLGVLKVIAPEDITPADGLLLKRALATYNLYKSYTPEHVLTLNYGTAPSDRSFPGDTIGRYILSTTLLSRILHQSEPETLKKVMAALPSMVNAEGYLGWVLPQDRADETGLSNIMWSNGLTEYALWTQDAGALKMDRNVFDRIILPVKEAYFFGPLLLGADAQTEIPLPKETRFTAVGKACYRAEPSGPTLVPLCDLRDLDDEGLQSRTGSVQILFKD